MFRLAAASTFTLTLETICLQVLEWWRSKKKVRYPGTLYVTVKGLTPTGVAQPITVSDEHANAEPTTPSDDLTGHENQHEQQYAAANILDNDYATPV